MKPILLALALLAATGPAAAKEFVILIQESPEALALRSRADAEGQAYWASFSAYGADLTKAGVLRGGLPLQPVDATAVDGRPLGGFFIIDVADQAAADAWAKRAPTLGGKAVAVPAATSPMIASSPSTAPTAR